MFCWVIGNLVLMNSDLITYIIWLYFTFKEKKQRLIFTTAEKYTKVYCREIPTSQQKYIKCVLYFEQYI
jgi:hypothetical protein